MSRAKTLYIDGDSIFHKLNGVSKILIFIVWTVITMMFLDIRVFIAMGILGTIMLYFSQISWKTIKPLLWIMIGFNLINIIFILLITPQYGTELVGTNTELINLGYSYINKETLFYALTISFKYAVLMPITVIFIFTTHPSEFASSLNKIGVPYKIAYAVNIAFRYIPDVQREYNDILNAQQARGLAFSKGEGKLFEILKNYTTIFVPLVSSSLKRIETVSNAMELRSFGKKKKRTWYSYKKMNKLDFIFIVICIILLIGTVYLKNNIVTGFYYPF